MDLFITFNTKLVTHQKFYLLSTCNPTITMEWKEKFVGWKQESHRIQVPILTFITSHNEITEYRQFDLHGRSNDLQECYSLMRKLVTENIDKMNLSEKYRYYPYYKFNDFKKETIYVSDTIEGEIPKDRLKNYKMTKCSIEIECIDNTDTPTDTDTNTNDKEPPFKKSKHK